MPGPPLALQSFTRRAKDRRPVGSSTGKPGCFSDASAVRSSSPNARVERDAAQRPGWAREPRAVRRLFVLALCIPASHFRRGRLMANDDVGLAAVKQAQRQPQHKQDAAALPVPHSPNDRDRSMDERFRSPRFKSGTTVHRDAAPRDNEASGRSHENRRQRALERPRKRQAVNLLPRRTVHRKPLPETIASVPTGKPSAGGRLDHAPRRPPR